MKKILFLVVLAFAVLVTNAQKLDLLKKTDLEKQLKGDVEKQLTAVVDKLPSSEQTRYHYSRR